MPRLSGVATTEKALLAKVLQDVTLVVGARFLKGTRKPFSVKGAYSQHMSTHPDNPHTMMIWNTALPPKCKFFFWLLHLDRLPTRARLHARHIAESNECPFYSAPETQEHLFLHCPWATQFWNDIGATDVSSSSSLHEIWDAQSVWGQPPGPLRSFLLITVTWNTWKARNATIF